MRDRGHRNTNERGSSHQRRRRRQWLLDKYGDGTTALCQVCFTVTVDAATLIVGRIIPWIEGGTYAQDNIRPECPGCSTREGAARTNAQKKASRA